MTKDKIIVKQKKMGRPVTIGGDEFVGLRLPSDLLGAIDAYAVANGLKRSEAIRHLIEFGLANTATAKAKRAKVKPRRTTQAPPSSAKKRGADK
jgi:hypothetical protein